MRLHFLAAGVMVLSFLVGCAGQNQYSQGKSIGSQIAATYGVQGFHRIERIRYTFNVKIGSKFIQRAWEWEPAVDRVTLHAGGQQTEPVTYRRDNPDDLSANLKKIDAWFINDRYWLLFPLHLAWDTQATIDDEGDAELPIGSGQARRVIVSYPGVGGYTPGDVYELFVLDNYQVIQWIYRRGGAPKPSRITTWEDHRRIGPLLISMDHHGKTPDFRVWFTNVAVKLAGSDQWQTGK